MGPPRLTGRLYPPEPRNSPRAACDRASSEAAADGSRCCIASSSPADALGEVELRQPLPGRDEPGLNRHGSSPFLFGLCRTALTQEDQGQEVPGLVARTARIAGRDLPT